MLLSLLACVLAAADARARVLHAAYELAEPRFDRDRALCGSDAGAGLVGYVDGRRVCADLLIDRLQDALSLIDAPTDEVVLLTSWPNQRTFYRAGPERRPILPFADLIRDTDRPLTIRGQRGPDGDHLVWFKGHDLIDTVCDEALVYDVAACRTGRPSPIDAVPSASWDGRYELMSLALIEQVEVDRVIRRRAEDLVGVTERGPRSYCVRIRFVRAIVLSDLAFEDCWMAAVSTVNSRDVTLQRALIHGSTFGFVALSTEGMEEEAHTFRVLDSHWMQSPAAYRSGDAPCANPHLDLGCAVDVWDDLPWGVAHHHLWRPLNGALFAAYNIAGNVLIAGNRLERAFNGVRIVSEKPGTGRNVEIRDNRFSFIRDNAVEPEERADAWVVSQNVFENVHAWITSDGVRGGTMYVFGNRGWYDPASLPGATCREDIDWTLSPTFVGMAGDSGRYLLVDTSYDPTSVLCRGHSRGVILKTGDKSKAGFPYLDHIAIFNNSWRTRSPLFASRHASPLSHFNNAVVFTGCGLDGAEHCRQIPAPVAECQAGLEGTRGKVALHRLWTSDGGALIADCFSLVPGPAEPDDRADKLQAVEHLFCRDLYNRDIRGLPYRGEACAPMLDTDVLAASQGDGLVVRGPAPGCRPTLRGAAVVPDCSAVGPPVGALLADGSPFRMQIPGAGFLGPDFRP